MCSLTHPGLTPGITSVRLDELLMLQHATYAP